MIKYERHQEILKILKQEHSATIKSLAKRIYTSEASVRRDVDILEKSGYVHKIYGGVVLSEYMNDIVPLNLRYSENSSKKENVAKKAAGLICDGDVIIMDSSSTVKRMCKYMNGFKNLKIITNNLEIFNEFNHNNFSLYCTGGKYNAVNNVFTGASAEEYLHSINADIVFFSSQAISNDGDITDISEEETSIRRVMLKKASKKVFLCDSSKIGDKKMFKLCNKNDIDVIICDTNLPWENI